LGALRKSPGTVTGTNEPEAKTPALPNDAPAAGPSLSIRVTLWPSRCNHKAVDMPTIPAPITIIFLGIDDSKKLSSIILLLDYLIISNTNNLV
jgi:hypothetical protein